MGNPFITIFINPSVLARVLDTIIAAKEPPMVMNTEEILTNPIRPPTPPVIIMPTMMTKNPIPIPPRVAISITIILQSLYAPKCRQAT